MGRDRERDYLWLTRLPGIRRQTVLRQTNLITLVRRPPLLVRRTLQWVCFECSDVSTSGNVAINACSTSSRTAVQSHVGVDPARLRPERSIDLPLRPKGDAHEGRSSEPRIILQGLSRFVVQGLIPANWRHQMTEGVHLLRSVASCDGSTSRPAKSALNCTPTKCPSRSNPGSQLLRKKSSAMGVGL